MPVEPWSETVIVTPYAPAVEEVSHIEHQRYKWKGHNDKGWPDGSSPLTHPQEWKTSDAAFPATGALIGEVFNTGGKWYFWTATKVITVEAQPEQAEVTEVIEHPGVECDQPFTGVEKFTPITTVTCEAATFAHPAFRSAFGTAATFTLYAGATQAEAQASAPITLAANEVYTHTFADPEVDSAAYFELKTNYGGSIAFMHQIGQKRVTSADCAPPVDEEPPAEDEEPIEEEPPAEEEQPIVEEKPAQSVETPQADELAATGDDVPLGTLGAALAAVAAGVALITRRRVTA